MKEPALAVWVTETGGETVDVPVPVLVAMEVAADCESSNGAQRFIRKMYLRRH